MRICRYSEFSASLQKIPNIHGRIHFQINDSFRKVIVVGDDIEPYTDDNGFNYVGIYDFLLSEKLF